MAEVLVFSIAAVFSGILGVITGGPFKIFVIRNEIIESVIARAIVAFVFFPPVVGVALMVSYFFLVKNSELGGFERGCYYWAGIRHDVFVYEDRELWRVKIA